MEKVALITGAAKRIGRHIAKSLAENGYSIAIHYGNSCDEAHHLVEEISKIGQKAILVQADLARESNLGQIFPEIETKLGVPHILINNASTFEPDPEEIADREIWDRHMNVNLRAPYYLSHELHKRIGKNGRGHIINMVDQRVLNLTPYFESYSYSKAALWAMTQTMALSFAPNIQVNAIGPGPTLANSRQSALDFQAQYESLPLQRATPLEDISNAILFLLNSSSITGEIITLDGGEHLGWCQENLSSPILE